MMKVGLVLLGVLALGEGVFLALHAKEISRGDALAASDKLRRDMCSSIKGELSGLKTFPRSGENGLAAERTMGWLSALAAPPLLAGCGTNIANVADEMQRAQDCFIKSADATCVADVAVKVAAQIKE
jgi:hypothetical protein